MEDVFSAEKMKYYEELNEELKLILQELMNKNKTKKEDGRK